MGFLKTKLFSTKTMRQFGMAYLNGEMRVIFKTIRVDARILL
jgi:hypothetical protein